MKGNNLPSDKAYIQYFIPENAMREYERQVEKWGDANAHIPNDRWIEILEDEFRDLKWAVRTCRESENHTIEKELGQVFAVALRWLHTYYA